MSLQFDCATDRDPGAGAERELQITPWSGAFVVVSPGTHSSLTGYDADGNVLGTPYVGD